MKKILSLFVVVLFSFTVLVGCGSKQNSTENSNNGADSSLADIQENGVLVLGCDNQFPPMGFEEDGELTGFDIELAKAVAEKLGVKLEPKAINWDTKELELSSNKIDAIWNGYTINAERNDKVEFTKPYLNNKQVLVVKKNSPIKAKADLAGKVVGTQIESAAQEVIDADLEFKNSLKELKTYENYDQAMLDLKSANRIDAVAGDLILVNYIISKDPNSFTVLADSLDNEYYGIGLRQGSVSLREAIDKALDELNEDGTVEKISKKWFGENIVVRDIPKQTKEELLANE